MKKYLLAILALLFIAICVLWQQNRRLKADYARVSANNAALIEDLDSFKTDNGQMAVTVQRLQLTLKEFKNQNQQLADQADLLRVRLRMMQSYSVNAMHSSVQFTVPLVVSSGKDMAIPVRMFRWADAWNSVDGVISGDSVSCSVQHRDTIDQIVYRVPRKFLFIRYGTKAIRQVVSLRDTSSRVEYSRYIELTRERKKSDR